MTTKEVCHDDGNYSEKLLATAMKRWLKVSELEYLLNPETTPLSVSKQLPPDPPPSGTLLLYDRNSTRHYKTDGYEWIKKRNTSKVREDHVKLRVNGEFRVAGFYAHCQTSRTIHRRSYHLLDPETGMTKSPLYYTSYSSSLVLLHYLNTSNAEETNAAVELVRNERNHKKRKISANIEPKRPSKQNKAPISNDISSTSDDSIGQVLVQEREHNIFGNSELVMPHTYLNVLARPGSVLLPPAPLMYINPFQYQVIQVMPNIVPSYCLRIPTGESNTLRHNETSNMR